MGNTQKQGHFYLIGTLILILSLSLILLSYTNTIFGLAVFVGVFGVVSTMSYILAGNYNHLNINILSYDYDLAN